MRNLIYQYWDGKPTQGVIAGTKAMKQYADRIGAEYLFGSHTLYQFLLLQPFLRQHSEQIR